MSADLAFLSFALVILVVFCILCSFFLICKIETQIEQIDRKITALLHPDEH